MTGFGAAEGAVGEGRIRVEIRTVNHRHFNPALKLPADLVSLEGRSAGAAAAKVRPGTRLGVHPMDRGAGVGRRLSRSIWIGPGR